MTTLSSLDVPRGNETILVAVHESSTREYSSWILHELGYKVIEAKDGHEALCVFHHGSSRKIDLLLADAVMPRMGGKELAHKISAFLPSSRVLITSQFPTELAIHNNLLSTELAYIQKPVTRQSLAVKVREVLDAANQESMMFAVADLQKTVSMA